MIRTRQHQLKCNNRYARLLAQQSTRIAVIECGADWRNAKQLGKYVEHIIKCGQSVRAIGVNSND